METVSKTRREVKALVRELGELRDKYSLCDKSPENIARGIRIKEIIGELNIEISKPRADRRKPVVNFNKR